MSYNHIPSASLLASKYQRYGYVHPRPFLPGERFSASREMDRSLRGYKELRLGLAESRQTVARQERERMSMDRGVSASYYKSPVGCRSSKGSGSMFLSDPVSRTCFFSSIKTY